MDGMREGNCVYEKEIKELMEKYKAKGIILIVMNGSKNIDDTEVSMAIEARESGRLAKVLLVLAFELRHRFVSFISKTTNHSGEFN